MMMFMLRKGAGPPGLCLLTVPGRKTGIPGQHRSPQSRTARAAGSWRAWGRAAGHGACGRPGGSRSAGATPPRRSPPPNWAGGGRTHLKRYLAEHPRTVGAYFDVGKDGALADFATEPPWHPVFRLHPTGS